MLVSIIIPTYNRIHTLKRTIESVLSQTYKNWELIIVDNYSTDNTDLFVSSIDDNRIKLLKIHNNGVIGISRNLGVENSMGECLAFLDSDDWWLPNKLEKSVYYINQGADLTYHDMYLSSKKNQKFFFKKTRGRPLRAPVFNDLIRNGNPINNSSVLMKKNFLYKIGLFCIDKDMVAIEDYDAWLKVSKNTENFVKIPHTLGYYWCGGGNVSNPEKVLNTLDVFCRRYKSSIIDLKLQNDISWVNYTKGRKKYIIGDYDESLVEFKKVYFMNSSFYIKIKSLIMIMIILLKFK
jgi:glycosyltransferase involved in cell wall biosynthesis